jgi:(S)-3,5-dihydroxyphenylglycine transaminase
MLVLLMGLFEPGRDVLLSSDPAYIGITGLARILGVEVRPVPMGPEGLTAEAVAEAAAAVRRAGGRPRAVYDVPDFNNPLGTSIPVAERRRLLETAAEEDLLVFEDGPYRLFAYDGQPAPTLKHLDAAGVAGEPGRVVSLGSFSKTLFPGLRMGYLVADQRVADRPEGGGGGRFLAEALSRVKSLTTVNTPPVLQAAAAALLAEHGGSLAPRVARMLPVYRAGRDRMLERLEAELGGLAGVSWNRPGGGFFLTLTLPFAFDEACLEEAAGRHGVIVCPMSFFALAPGWERRVRLSFSYATPEQIDDGVARLAAFLRERA